MFHLADFLLNKQLLKSKGVSYTLPMHADCMKKLQEQGQKEQSFARLVHQYDCNGPVEENKKNIEARTIHLETICEMTGVKLSQGEAGIKALKANKVLLILANAA